MPERIRTLDALLTELNRSPICDRIVLPTGIRHLLNLDGTVVNSVDELVDGGNYVCASTMKLKRIAYLNITGPSWNNSARAAEGIAIVVVVVVIIIIIIIMLPAHVEQK